jgi:hypothetical protein
MKREKMKFSINMSLAVMSLVFFFSLLDAQQQNWVYLYDTPNHADDRARAITCGADGNIYAAGVSDDAAAWRYDILVVSLNPDGDTNWTYRYNGTGDGEEECCNIVYGADGNIYLTGSSSEITRNQDLIIISLTNTGIERWKYFYDGPDHDVDQGRDIVYGNDGNIYAVGYAYASYIDANIIAVSVDTAGAERWTYQYEGPDEARDRGFSIAYGLDDNIYITGETRNATTGEDWLAISLDTAGNERWVWRDNLDFSDDCISIAYGLDNNVYTAGEMLNTANGSYDFAVRSFTTSGDERWVFYHDMVGLNEYAHVVIAGHDGNVYAGGYGKDTSGYYDALIVSCDTAGVERWAYRLESVADTNDYIYSIVHGADGNIYAVGTSIPSMGYPADFKVYCVDSMGTEQWVYNYVGTHPLGDYGYDIDYGLDGNVYAAGYNSYNSMNTDFLVISLKPGVGVQEKVIRRPSTDYPSSTILTGPLLLPRDKKCKIFDITGQKINTLNPAPGIYFIEIDGKITHKVIKIR